MPYPSIPSPPPSNGPAGTPSLRTLGTSSVSAAAGNDSRLAIPSGAALTATPNRIPQANGSGILDPAWLADASASVRGLVSTDVQTFAGAKTFEELTVDNGGVGSITLGADGSLLYIGGILSVGATDSIELSAPNSVSVSATRLVWSGNTEGGKYINIGLTDDTAHAAHTFDAGAGTIGTPISFAYLLRVANGGVSKLTVNKDGDLKTAGLIESTGSGFKFPDGSIQTTAGGGGGGGISGSGSTGRVPYFTGSTAIGNSGLTWDNTNSRLGINKTSPAQLVDIGLGGTARAFMSGGSGSANPMMALDSTSGKVMALQATTTDSGLYFDDTAAFRVYATVASGLRAGGALSAVQKLELLANGDFSVAGSVTSGTSGLFPNYVGSGSYTSYFNGASLNLLGQATDGSTAVGIIYDNSHALANATAKLGSWRNATVEKAWMGKDGDFHSGGVIESTVGGFKFPDGTTSNTSIQQRFLNLKIVNPLDVAYGALGDGSTDDQTSIQAALTAVNGLGGKVSMFPTSSRYRINKPLVIDGSNVTLEGSEGYLTEIVNLGNFFGPMLYVGPSWAGTPTRASLATGPGAAMDLNGTADYYHSLAECDTVNIDGLSAGTVEFFFIIDSDPAAQSSLVACQGRRDLGDGNIDNFAGENTDHTFLFRLEKGTDFGGSAGQSAIVTGFAVDVGFAEFQTIHTGFLGTPFYVDNSIIHHAAVTYDNANVTLWVDGNQVTQTAVTGPLIQFLNSTWFLGPSFASYPEAIVSTNMIDGGLDSVRISKTCRYSANFTPPTAKFTWDTDTLFLHNFDNEQGVFSVAQAKHPSATSSLPAYLPTRRPALGAVTATSQVTLRNLFFNEASNTHSPIFFQSCTNFLVENVKSHCPVRFINNCFEGLVTNCFISTNARENLSFNNACGVVMLRDSQLIGGVNQYVAAVGGGYIDNVYFAPTTQTVTCMVIKGDDITGLAEDTVFTIKDVSVDDEGVLNTRFETPVALSAMNHVNVLGGNFDCGTVVGCPKFKVDGGRKLSITGAAFVNYDLTHPIVVCHTQTKILQPVIFSGCTQYKNSVVPWTDNTPFIMLGDAENTDIVLEGGIQTATLRTPDRAQNLSTNASSLAIKAGRGSDNTNGFGVIPTNGGAVTVQAGDGGDNPDYYGGNGGSLTLLAGNGGTALTGNFTIGSNGGAVTIDAGSGSGDAGQAGYVYIGTSTAAGVSIGHSGAIISIDAPLVLNETVSFGRPINFSWGDCTGGVDLGPPSGICKIPSGQDSQTFNCNATSVWFQIIDASADATLTYLTRVVYGSGTVTVYGNAVATSDVTLNFVAFNDPT